MADNINALVGDNDAPATWTDVNDITPDQKVLIGTIDERSGNMKAEWRPSSQAAVFKEKTITENSIYDPRQEGADGYSMVTVEVPNTYVAADEGKVVSGGALVAQTARTESITENGTYDTTENNSVTVNVAAPSSDMNAKVIVGDTPNEWGFDEAVSTVNIPTGVTGISGGSLQGCEGLTDVTIPSTVTTIGQRAFEACISLVSIDIPSSVTQIGERCFKDCDSLETVTIHKAEDAIAGAPWGAPETAQIVWTGE